MEMRIKDALTDKLEQATARINEWIQKQRPPLVLFRRAEIDKQAPGEIQSSQPPTQAFEGPHSV
jgi:hypothetical protein